ncbi:glutathione S-transferase family protein [Noviherbaspirillum sp.]|uniref:glutathione S-transferase family protein n=1 Tax=Noviherbaspirillum sp. TaxID=1926288 RepID=UPI002D2C103F|nr:glutathione S-transferase family protein [Noviherbaspirillum sp.]HZW21005.1 glutathione S-transferase family protein [Noviherbaspirillum sp.]
MITLFHCVSARSFRPLWTMEELGMRHGTHYELRMLPFPPRVHQREYLSVNPLGTVPAFFDGEVKMTESAAIAQYLVTKYGPSRLAVAPDEPAYGAWLNWLHYGEATLTFPQTLVLRYRHMEPEERRLPQAAEDYQRWFLARLRAIDAALAGTEYLCAGRFTAADMSVGYALMLAEYLELQEQFPPAVRAYWERLKQREGYRRALEAQEHAAGTQGVSTVPAPLAWR